MLNSRSRTHIRLWVLMLAAFVIVGGCASIAIVQLTIGKYEHDARNELLSLSKVIALQLSADSQLQLNRERPQAFHELNAILIRAKRQAGSIRRIYTIRRAGGVYQDALDSSVKSESPLPASVLTPAPNVDRAIRSTFDSGSAAVDEDISEDPKQGPSLSAYVPLIDSTGHVVAVLVIERDAIDIATHVESIKQSAALAIGMVLLMGSLFSLIIVRQLARSANSEAWIRGATTSIRIFRATLLELLLCGMAMGVLAIGFYSQARIGQLAVDENVSVERTKALEQYRTRIHKVLQDTDRDSKGLHILAESSGKDGLDWLSAGLEAAAQSKTSDWREPLWQSLVSIGKKSEDEQQARARIRAEMGDMNDKMTSALILAILLSTGCLVLLRSAASQQQELHIAKHESQRHQVAYEQVATNLPIGFYTYCDGLIEDSNAMWDSMVTRMPGEDRLMALERSVHEEDIAALISELRKAQETGAPFSLHFRLRAAVNEIRFFETRGVWVNKPQEGIDNLLGFFLDITDLAEVQEELEIRTSEVERKNAMLSRALCDLEENLEAMVHGLVKAVEAKDPYTAGHSERVMRYSVSIGESLGLSPKELRILERGTLIHDVGKIGIPDAVLNKPGRLSDSEFEIIKAHPSIGARMVRGIPVFEECLPIIEGHHERLDGRGYPHGLVSHDIPLMVRIASVADVFDAVTSCRAYRAAMDVDEAIEILRKDAQSGALDRKIVEVLADIVKRDGVLWAEIRDEAA